MRTVIYGGEVYSEDRVIEKGVVIITNEKIERILDVTSFCEIDLPELPAVKNANCAINASCTIIAPGSIEMHTNGFVGYNFGNITAEGLKKVLEEYPKYGVTNVTPTLITEEKQNIKKALEDIVNYHENNNENMLLPCYLEARYFCDTNKKGAHNSKYLVNSASNDKNLQQIILDEVSEFDAAARGFLKLITIDPSLEDANYIIKQLVSKDYKVVIGHSDCTREEAEIAIDNGASILSHAFNAISMEKDYYGYRISEDKKIKNALGVCLDDERVFAELIIDFVHSRQEYDKMLIERKGFKHTCLITDACAATKSEKKENLLGDEEVIIISKDGYDAAYRKNNTLCGSVLTMDKAIMHCVELGYFLKDAFEMASLIPAKALGIDNTIGSISQNKYANIAIYEKAIEKINGQDNINRTLCTLVEGQIKYSAEDFKNKIKILK